MHKLPVHFKKIINPVLGGGGGGGGGDLKMTMTEVIVVDVRG